jgi:hypothetical protein
MEKNIKGRKEDGEFDRKTNDLVIYEGMLVKDK